MRPKIYTQTMYSDYSISFFDKIGSIGVHSVTHSFQMTDNDTTWYKEYKYFLLMILSTSYFRAIAALKKYGGVVFDSSAVYAKYYNQDGNKTAWWPFTLDHGFPETSLC